jgi:hypothetical protein
MAKIIYDSAGRAVGYQPGVIYDLGMIIDGQRIPFYVGETSNPTQRFKDHVRQGENATDDSTLVYQTIKKLNEDSIKWTMATLAKFGSEGPTDLEDEWIMKHLYDGRKLSNMKKGNANWLAEREAVAGDMKRRGVSSYRKYKEVLSAEEKQAEATRKHAEWMAQEQERLRREEEIKLQTQRFKEQEELRKRIAEEIAAKQAEIIRQRQEESKRKAEAKAAAAAKWEADRPAREARIKAEAERLQQEEQRRQEQAEANRRERRRIEDQAKSELIERANENYGDWPDLEDRLRHQRSEDADIKVMLDAGYTKDQITHYVKKDRNMHWHPGRAR